MREIPAERGSWSRDGCDLYYEPDYLDPELSIRLYHLLKGSTPWKSDRIRVFGKVYEQPRLTCFFGKEIGSYTYSGIEMKPEPFPDFLVELLNRINQEFGLSLNCCLANYYRDGMDSNGWHSDNEKELGPEPTIASVSLGGERFFHLRPRANPSDTHKIRLESGSLLLMYPPTQQLWQHQIPKSKLWADPRINLTFRKLESAGIP